LKQLGRPQNDNKIPYFLRVFEFRNGIISVCSGLDFLATADSLAAGLRALLGLAAALDATASLTLRAALSCAACLNTLLAFSAAAGLAALDSLVLDVAAVHYY